MIPAPGVYLAIRAFAKLPRLASLAVPSRQFFPAPSAVHGDFPAFDRLLNFDLVYARHFSLTGERISYVYEFCQEYCMSGERKRKKEKGSELRSPQSHFQNLRKVTNFVSDKFCHSGGPGEGEKMGI
jgi:hypothetical protein